MTISNAEFEITVVGNSLTTTFSYTFNMVNAAYSRLIFTDAAGTTASISSADYSLTGVGSASGGTFTYPLVGSPITAGESLTLQRILPLTQDVSIDNQGNFYPAAVEAGLDNLTMIAQQIQGQVDNLEETQGITSIATGAGLTGGPITQSGTISVSDGGITTSLLGAAAVTYAKIQAVTNGYFLGNFSGATATVSENQFVAGSGISITPTTGSVTIASTVAGTVTRVDTGTGMTGGPITVAGTVSIATNGVTTGLINNSAVTLAKMADLTDQRLIGNFSGAAAAPAEISLIQGANMVITRTTTSLTFAATTGSTNSGTVTVVDTGTGLTGGPVTTSGTVSLAAINTGYFLGNFSGGSAAPVGVQLVAGSGITFSSTTTSLTITASSAMAFVASITASSSTASFTFGSLPAGYKDLQIRLRARGTKAANNVQVYLQFNGDSGNNYNSSWGAAFGSFASDQAITASSIRFGFISAASSNAGNIGTKIINVFDYAGNTFFKHVSSLEMYIFANQTDGVNSGTAGGNWLSTASITSLVLFCESGNFITGSEASLYVIL